jgi:hypothetical protein
MFSNRLAFKHICLNKPKTKDENKLGPFFVVVRTLWRKKHPWQNPNK